MYVTQKHIILCILGLGDVENESVTNTTGEKTDALKNIENNSTINGVAIIVNIQGQVKLFKNLS